VGSCHIYYKDLIIRWGLLLLTPFSNTERRFCLFIFESVRAIISSLLIMICASCNQTHLAQKKNPIIQLDSSFLKLDDELYARTNFNDSTELGDIFIYKLNRPGELSLIQHIDSLHAEFIFGIDTFTDFDNDRRKDLLVAYGFGARGSNKLNYLFVQREKENKATYFEYVRGSDYPPNLYYDTARKVIESTMFHGGVTFVDYKVIEDSLVELGGVDVTGDEKWVIRIHYLIDGYGNRIETKRDSVFDGFDDFYSR
ncbi:hypothetical protein, partial [Polluticoccus soli]|uniref:hypothetical protein n=1 Tax=Polluticoccus soli TaxID=3034150 RepID=UPI0023E3276C